MPGFLMGLKLAEIVLKNILNNRKKFFLGHLNSSWHEKGKIGFVVLSGFL